jgi:protein-tyrosine phosphatase
LIDIHCHILSGLDDGAADLEESIAMARLAFEDGVRHLFATPHFTRALYNDREQVEAKVRELQAALDERGIAVRIHPGSEVRMESGAFVRGAAETEAFCYLGPHRRFVLLEEPWSDYQPESPALVRWFLERGVRPVIPHPERHAFFRERPERLRELIELGAWTQVTADSLIGNNSEDARRFALAMLREGLVHTLATDAHNVRRKPNLSLGYEAVEQAAGRKAADAIRERMRQFVES